MKMKLFTMVLLLIGLPAVAQKPISVSISSECDWNGQRQYCENGHCWVDLGLSVKWSTTNVGAKQSEGYGNYYAWGETEPNSDYAWTTYKHCEGSYVTLTKYCTNSDFGLVDNKTTLEAMDDAVNVAWGADWRMPTRTEWMELYEECTWLWTIQNGVNGCKVTGRNGNSIFLPATGGRNGKSLNLVGSYGNYWSSSLHENYSNYAYYIYFNMYDMSLDYVPRYNGLCARAVCQGDTIISDHSLTIYADGCDSPNIFYCKAGQQLAVNAIPKVGYCFVKWSDGNTDNPRLVTMSQNLTYTAIFENYYDGKCGDDLHWQYNNATTTLTISGTGDMYADSSSTMPWYRLRDSITSVIIEEGVTSLGDYAFNGCCNLQLITCYAINPPTVAETTFEGVSQNIKTYVLAPALGEYQSAIGWKNLNVLPISSIQTPITKDEVLVTPSANNVTFTWPANEAADSYTLEIYKDRMAFYTLRFNAHGQLIGLTFAHGRNGVRTLPAATQTINGWQFTVEGFDLASKYAYTIDVQDAGKQIIKSYKGEFVTDGYSTLKDIHSSQPVSKFIRDGQLYIQCDGKTYTTQGTRIE